MQGQSYTTEEKIRGFKSVFDQQLSIFNVVSQRSSFPATYFHFDCHGGCGWNHLCDVVGSPLLFAERMRALRSNALMWVAERDRDSCVGLAQRLANEDRAFPLLGDNAEMVSVIPEIIRGHGENPQYAIGSILVDPNNPSDGIPWEALDRVATTCPKLDIIFNYPGTAMKRIGSEHSLYVSIDDIPLRVKKRYALIRHPLPTHQFTLVVLRNAKFKGNGSVNLFDWDSDNGINARRKVLLNAEEYQRWLMRNSPQMELKFSNG